jgi:hypothetical protein
MSSTPPTKHVISTGAADSLIVRCAAERPLYLFARPAPSAFAPRLAVYPYAIDSHHCGTASFAGSSYHSQPIRQHRKSVFAITFFQFHHYFFSSVWTSFPVLHKEWCNFFFLGEGVESRPVFRATIEPVW